jgi:membrane associated rhomboid family serine protease
VLGSMISTATPDEGEMFAISRTGMIFFGVVIAATWGQMATALIGLPAHVWLMHYTRRRAWMYAVTGALAGTAFGATFVWAVVFGVTFPYFADVIWLAIAGATAGACAGLTFWLIRRPDRDLTTPKTYDA